MIKRLLLLVFIFIFLISSVLAVDYSFEFQSVETLEPVHGCVAYFNTGETIYNKYLHEDEAVTLTLEEIPTLLEITVDVIDTAGFDYYTAIYTSEITLSEENKVNVVLLPEASSLRGTVKDKLDNVVSNAKLKFECANLNPTTHVPEYTDEFGSFFIEAMPVGECKIHATFEDGAGSTTVNLQKGDLQDIEIKLDKSIIYDAAGFNYLYFVPVLLVIIAALVYLFLKTREIKQLNQEVKQEEKEIQEFRQEETTIKLRSILKTLNEKESAIVNLFSQRD